MYMYIEVKKCCVYLCERSVVFGVEKFCTNNITRKKVFQAYIELEKANARSC